MHITEWYRVQLGVKISIQVLIQDRKLINQIYMYSVCNSVQNNLLLTDSMLATNFET
jgi:hypothetical protein